jgi:ribose transport system substrate-binding protein
VSNTSSARPLRARRQRRVAAVAAVAAASTIVAAGCSSSGSGSASSTTPAAGGSSSVSTKGWTFVDVPGITTDAFYITLYNGAFAEGKTRGINVTYQGSSQSGAPPSVQVGIVNSLLATSPKALIISPGNVTALIPPIQKFVSAGIPVVAVDTTINDPSLLVTQITSNNTQGGQLAAETIGKEHNYQGQVAVENVPPGVSTTDARLAGFKAQIKKYPKMSIIAVENDNGEATLAEAQSKSLILGHPGLVGIFGTNLDGGQGAGAAVVASNKKGKITVVAYDAEPAEVSLLKEGVVSALIIQQPTLEGQDAVKYAYDYLAGKKSEIPKKVLVPNVVATTKNANDPSISKYFYSQTVAK